jgi:hypothetical protein
MPADWPVKMGEDMAKPMTADTVIGRAKTEIKAANDNYPMVLTRCEAASMCKISLSTFDNWVRRGVLPRPLPGTHRWSRFMIEQKLTGGSTDGASGSYFATWKESNAVKR